MNDKFRNVRMATPEDAVEIYELMKLAHEECGEHEMNAEKVLWRINLATHRQASFVGVVCTDDGVIAGYVLIMIEPIWYSDDVQLLEVSNFVHPDHRRSDYAKQLIAFAKHSADDLGVDLTMGVISNSRTLAKCRLYRRQLPFVGEFYCYHPSERN